MRKVFLCHSSQDKDYIRVVARHLGRGNIIFDEVSFEPGHDFRDEIEKGLNTTALFVFFASESSLKSLWCKYEYEKATFLQFEELIRGHLIIIIDRNVKYADIPKWLQKAKAVIQTRPSQATRDIQHALITLLDSSGEKPYIGRQRLYDEFLQTTSDISSPVKKLIVLSGLEGIGRRAYLKRICKDIYGLYLQPFIFIDHTKSLDDLYLHLLNETADLGTRSNLSSELKVFNSKTIADKISEIVNQLNILCSDNCIPCFVDKGGMLDDKGLYKSEYAEIISAFVSKDNDYYLSIVHQRVPILKNYAFQQHTVFQRVPALDQGESRLLLQQLIRRDSLKPNPKTIEDILLFLDGYPPSFYFAITFSREYGFDNLVADKSLLVDFKAKRFTKFVADLKLTDHEWFILQYFCSEGMLPLSAISVAAELSLEETAKYLRNLIDNNLVIVIDDNFGINSPIRVAVFWAKGYIGAKVYAKIKENLTKQFWSADNAAPTIEIVDATLHALARSGSTDLDSYKDLIRISTIHRLAEESYHRKEYNEALEYAKRAENMGSNKSEIKAIHFKSLVQLERWEKASEKLREIEVQGDRHAYYLTGFMLRKQKRFKEAIEAFKSALSIGDHSYPVYRDYADSLYRCGEYDEAFKKINWVLEHDSENIFVLDLVVRIFLDQGLYDKAKEYLNELERFDLDKRFIYHRKARYYSAKKMWELALNEADAACNTGISPFEAYAQRVDILIHLRQFNDAEEALNKMNIKFRNHQRDIQNGLRCKLLIRKNKWHEAKTVWDQIDEKTTPVHKALLKKIFELKGADLNVPLGERESALKQAVELEEAASNLPDFFSSIINIYDDERDEGYAPE